MIPQLRGSSGFPQVMIWLHFTLCSTPGAAGPGPQPGAQNHESHDYPENVSGDSWFEKTTFWPSEIQKSDFPHVFQIFGCRGFACPGGGFWDFAGLSLAGPAGPGAQAGAQNHENNDFPENISGNIFCKNHIVTIKIPKKIDFPNVFPIFGFRGFSCPGCGFWGF